MTLARGAEEIDKEATTAAVPISPIAPRQRQVATFAAAFILRRGVLTSVGLTGLLVHVLR